MSEQTPKPVSSDAGSLAAGTITGSYPVLVGRAKRAPGNALPEHTAQKPDLERIAQELNIASRSLGRDLLFKVDLDKGTSVIQVLDQETGEIIRQIPADEAALIVKDIGTSRIHFFDQSV